MGLRFPLLNRRSESLSRVFVKLELVRIWSFFFFFKKRFNLGLTYLFNDMVVIDLEIKEDGGLCMGRGGEKWKQSRHIWLVPNSTATTVAVNDSNTLDFFCKVSI